MPSHTCGKDAIKPWWFAVSKEDPKEVTVCFNDLPYCGSNEGGSPCRPTVTKVEAATPSHIQIHFSDGTNHKFPVQGFAEDKGDFKHSLKASIECKPFADQFKKDLEPLKNPGSPMKTAAMIGIGAVGAALAVSGAVLALPAICIISPPGVMSLCGMSASATIGGGGTAGSAVAVMPSVGAAGLGAAGAAAVGSAGAAVGAAVSRLASKIW